MALVKAVHCPSEKEKKTSAKINKLLYNDYIYLQLLFQVFISL